MSLGALIRLAGHTGYRDVPEDQCDGCERHRDRDDGGRLPKG